LAFGLYCDDYNDYVPYTGMSWGIDAGYNLGAWYNILSPYLKQPRLADLYDSIPPKIPLPGQKSIYVCPSLTAPASTWTPPASTSNPWFGYAMNRVLRGLSGRLYKRSSAVLPAQTILFSESENNSFPFTDGYYLGPYAPPPPVPPRHSGGMNFVFVDGHAQWYSLADYGRNQPMTRAQVEWAVPRAVYWFPCSTCNKD